MKEKQKGIFLMVASAFLFAAGQIAVRLTGERIPLMEQLFMRNLVSLFIALIILKQKKIPLFGDRKYHPWLLGRSFFGLLGMATLFYASSHAHQGDVAILEKMSPFFTTIFAAIFLKEKIAKIQFPAMLLAFVGAFFVANPQFQSTVLPLLMALASAVFSGIAYTLLSYFKDKVDGYVVVLYFSTFSTLVALPFMLYNFVMPTLTEGILLLLIGVFSGFGQLCITYAYRFAPAGEISIYNYSGIIFSILLGYFCLGESIPGTSFLGGALVLAASLLVYFYQRKNKTA